jgi:drug/metabolite transporter (DMT)-like permease
MMTAALATLPIALWLGHFRRQNNSPIPYLKIALIGLFHYTGSLGLLFVSMRYVSASQGAILLFTNPIWVALLSRFFLNETSNLQQRIGLIIGIFGVSLAVGVHLQGDLLRGTLIGLCSALSWSFATIVAKRTVTPLGAWGMSFWQLVVGTLGLGVLAASMGETFPKEIAQNSDFIYFFWLAIPATTGSFGLWFLALRQGGAMKSSSFLFLVPLITALLSPLFFDTTLSLWQYIGGICIGTSLYLVNQRK